MTTVLYGIPNCDTVKKARVWLDDHGIAYSFHDYKKAGVPADKLAGWCKRHGWETVLNRKGTTFRKLPDVETADLDQPRAIALMLHHASAIKRPIIEVGRTSLVGFDAAAWVAVFTR